MKRKMLIRFGACAIAALFLGAAVPAWPAMADSALSASAEVAVYSTGTEREISRSGKKTFDLQTLRNGEYASFVFYLRNNSGKTVSVRSAYARIDGGEKLGWASFELASGAVTAMHIFYSNMGKLGPGTYRVALYVNDAEVASDYLTLYSSFPQKDSPGSAVRGDIAPYLVCRPDFGSTKGYTEYAVDFMAERQPKGTYLCLCNWDMDLGSLRKKYASVYREYNGVAAYAGVQVIDTGEHLAIMSVWDTFCKDRNGNVTTIRAKVTHSPNLWKTQPFGGEGTGTQCLVKYNWKANHPYRMLIQQSASGETGNCKLSMWICDLETMEWSLLIEYDTGIPADTYMTSACCFLENYLPQYAGHYRDMRLFNFRARDYRTGRWAKGLNASMEQNYNHSGSYTYGSDGSCFWAMSTGDSGIWPQPGNRTFSVRRCEDGAPYSN